MKLKHVFTLLAVSGLLVATETSFAKRTEAEQATKDAAKIEKKASKTESVDDNSTTDKAAKKAAKAIEDAAKKASKVSAKTRVELIVRAKLDEVANSDEAVEIEEGREATVRYRSKDGKHLLKVRVERFALGSAFLVTVNGISLGEIESIQQPEGIEAGLDLNDGNWPQGLPLELTAGMTVKIVGEAGEIILDGVLAAK